MRKYDIKNKRNIGIIIAISVLIIIMFSLVIRLFLSIDKKEYQVIPGTLVFDKDKTIVKVESNATIKMKWNKEYYLKYNDKDIELGTSAISYNEDTGELHLYGRYYEISAGDEINITSDETIIKSTALTKFYKLADRKYLVVDKEIKSADGLLSTTDFLMVDLDKVGNATLTNHKVNLKTFSETTIVTSNYTFDIANEILTYGSDKIDLKKIIGSSNTYTKEDLVPEENTNGTSNNGITNVTENNTTNGNNNSQGETAGDNNNRNNTVIEEIKKATKRTSVISVTSNINKITVDYYGVPTPINQMAGISVPEPRMIVIQPWDMSVLKEIEKAINLADIGINPNNDGKVIRLVFPELTEERRKELAKQIRKMAEEAKVAVRSIRRDAIDEARTAQKNSELTEDELKQAEDKIQKITDSKIEEIDKILENKEKEIMTV